MRGFALIINCRLRCALLPIFLLFLQQTQKKLPPKWPRHHLSGHWRLLASFACNTKTPGSVKTALNWPHVTFLQLRRLRAVCRLFNYTGLNSTGFWTGLVKCRKRPSYLVCYQWRHFGIRIHDGIHTKTLGIVSLNSSVRQDKMKYLKQRYSLTSRIVTN